MRSSSLTGHEAIRKGIPAEFLAPDPAQLQAPARRRDRGRARRLPPARKPLAIIDCDLPEEVIERRHPAFWRYLEQGKAAGYPLRLSGQPSNPVVFAGEASRPPLPSVPTWAGRAADGNPFRFFWNKSQAVAANVYLMLYPKGEMKAALDAQPELYPLIFAHLQSLTGEHLIKEGRVYGGGLHKMEPKELANMPAGELARMIQ